ncbi:hypothetical protein [Alkaliphilus hydrothermalis]|uniref:Uncharacterized protein n=1 Tax=Alkaliphilus hydrothermalis TaxID=1482730 RepID=A0ABS2NPY7_9FIRM|nr:hypothetical protein [Alkaliphilus hydrothermalis]MBM7615003.1 hypothetical protein [Alkaliphilus hydrothermalis]
MKKIVFLLTCSIMIMSSMFTSFAVTNEESVAQDIKTTNPIFYEFLSESEVSKIAVINVYGEIVNDKHSADVKKSLEKGNYNEVISMLIEFDLALTHDEKIKKNKISGGNEITPYTISSEVQFTKEFYELRTDSTGTFTKEWITKLSGKYIENSDGTFTAMGNPSITVIADFGSSFSVNPRSYSTGYSYQNSNRAISFYGSYTMDATASVPLNIGGFEFPIGKTFTWGQIYRSHTVQ